MGGLMNFKAMETKLAKTNGGLPVLEVGLDEKVICLEEAIATLRRESGMVELPHDTIAGLANLGIYARGVGVLRTQRGRVMITQTGLANNLKIMTERLNSEHARGTRANKKLMVELSNSISRVAAVLNDSVEAALSLEKVAAPSGKPDDIEPPRNTAFQPGPVIAAKEVHIHEAQKSLPKDGNGT